MYGEVGYIEIFDCLGAVLGGPVVKIASWVVEVFGEGGQDVSLESSVLFFLAIELPYVRQEPLQPFGHPPVLIRVALPPDAMRVYVAVASALEPLRVPDNIQVNLIFSVVKSKLFCSSLRFLVVRKKTIIFLSLVKIIFLLKSFIDLQREMPQSPSVGRGVEPSFERVEVREFLPGGLSVGKGNYRHPQLVPSNDNRTAIFNLPNGGLQDAAQGRLTYLRCKQMESKYLSKFSFRYQIVQK